MMPPLLLLVDDNDLLRFAYRHVLQAAGFRVADAPNGAAGLDAARAQLPDLVLLDLDMPVLDGWQTVAVLTRDPRTAGIPVIAHTGDAAAGVAEAARRAGFHGHAGKHLTPDDLVAFVGDALRRTAAGERWVGSAATGNRGGEACDAPDGPAAAGSG